MNTESKTPGPGDNSGHGHKTVLIYINTREHRLAKESITYQELVELAAPGDVPNDEKVYEIIYTNPHGKDGKVGVGGKVQLKEGMVFDVHLANRS